MNRSEGGGGRDDIGYGPLRPKYVNLIRECNLYTFQILCFCSRPTLMVSNHHFYRMVSQKVIQSVTHSLT